MKAPNGIIELFGQDTASLEKDKKRPEKQVYIQWSFFIYVITPTNYR